MTQPSTGQTLDVATIAEGLAGLFSSPRESSDAVVFLHVSLRSFGPVAGGAATVVAAARQAFGTVLMFGAVSELTGLPAPPGTVRPDNSYVAASSWAEFDWAVAHATPSGTLADRPGLATDRWLGAVAAEFARQPDVSSGDHPLYPFRAVGPRATELVAAQRPDRMLGPVEVLERLDGQVVLLGVGHHANTTIHLAEQRLGMGQFYRYALLAPGVWAELPNISGESHHFDALEPRLVEATTEVWIGGCRARRIGVREVLEAATASIEADPTGLLCTDPTCRCAGALQQRLAHLDRPPAT